MTDEGTQGHPLDPIEAANAMANMASLMRTFYENLISEGFKETEAFEMLRVYLHATAGGKLG